MSKVSLVNPNTISVEFRQEHGDKDYGKCLWAVFTFDLDNYRLSIQSDCGSYAYQWFRTEHEPFLELMCRIDQSYLLGKIAREDTPNSEETEKRLSEYIQDVCDDSGYTLNEEDRECISNAASERNIYDFVNSVLYDFSCSLIQDNLDSYEISDCFTLDYSPQAYTIVRIFSEYIQPFLQMSMRAWK